MSLRTKNPSAELKMYIHRYTHLQLSRETQTEMFPNGSFRLPNPIIRLAFHFSANIPWIDIKNKTVNQARFNVRGYQKLPITFNTKDALDVFSIEFTPFGFNRIFGISCSELDVTPIPLENIVNKDYPMLLEELTIRSSFQERVTYMNDYFFSKIRHDINIQKAYNIEKYILKHKSIPTVNLLANDVFISERTMRRFFNIHFGISPKSYLRLLRFEKTIKALSLENKKNLFDLALNFGYYDHAHFSNDFKFFMNMTPKEFQQNILRKEMKEY